MRAGAVEWKSASRWSLLHVRELEVLMLTGHRTRPGAILWNVEAGGSRAKRAVA